MSADLRPVRYDINLIRGDDFELVITVVNSAGGPIDVSTATIDAEILSTGAARDVALTMTDAVSGVGNNIITLTMTDTQTSTNLDAAKYRWSLSVTISGDTQQWIGGVLQAHERGDYRASTSSGESITATIDESITLTIAATGNAADVAANDDRYLQLTGADPMTGPLTIDATAPVIELHDTDGTVDESRYVLEVVTDRFDLRALTDAGAQKMLVLRVDPSAGANGTLLLCQSGGIVDADTADQVRVPLPLDKQANQAAQIVDVDSDTGVLDLSGMPAGNTGWRDMGAALVNGWTATRCWLMRDRNTAWLHCTGLDGSSATSDNFLPMQDGWYRHPAGATIRLPVMYSASAVTALSLGGNGGHFSLDRSIGAFGGFEVPWPVSYDSYPATLPGTLATGNPPWSV